MPAPFGPQLIGETEKTLNALLRRVLAGRLTEPQWVTLRLSLLLEEASSEELVAAVGARAHFEEAGPLVAGLSEAGLLEGGRPTAAAQALVAEVQQEIATLTDPIWDGLPSADVDAAARVLNAVVVRARAALAR